MNPMQQVRLEKLTLNIGAGKEQAKLDKGVALLKAITGIDPVKTVTMKRIPSWGLRPGLPIGCKITLRRAKAQELLGRLLKARESKLRPSQFDGSGNISFGIPEYIDIPGVAYDPKIGVMGLQVCVTLEKPGYRVKRRKLMPRQVPRRHLVSRDEAVGYMQQTFNVTVEEKEEATA
jgi:large subunit ribosomal protein L5